ncbi:hypothetical protein QQS21_004947 [Conoideocrella luteorostrata]|uniref:Ras modification protein ERF4 n=1 Tax=Conoideocrella luteorostrata TaxID=1105319 RepID=A0AAJ0CT42_9HYPO|nr:hypothetical protein QQS21_004947 [Conoideocrella luteorostrata]
MSPALWPFWRQKPPLQELDINSPRVVGFVASPAAHDPQALANSTEADNLEINQGEPEAAGSAIVTGIPEAHPSIPPEQGRHDHSVDPNPTKTSDGLESSFASKHTPVVDRPANSRLKTFSHQPAYPVASFEAAAESAAAAVAALNPQHPSTASRQNNANLIQSPFRSRAKAVPTTAHRLRRLPAARLWNPTNSTPRIPEHFRKRRPSTPPLPTVPLQHPSLDTFADTSGPVATGAGNYPLLTLSEQRQARHSISTRASLQVERTGTGDRRVSLPHSVRASYDGQYSLSRTSITLEAVERPLSPNSHADGGIASLSAIRKGKQKATMAPDNEDSGRSFWRDLERGPDVTDPRVSNVSAGDGIGSAISSSNSSIMGEDVQPDAGEEWGPQHPCYPHWNPHVPLNSIEYATTRIIRVKRDWLVAGDLAPTFSNLYPEILDPAGVSEQEFRRVVEKMNGELIPIFDPFSFRNVMDSVLGLVTGWLWDDFGLTAAKSRLNNLEKWIEKWNQEMEKTMASEEGVVPPKLISLRQTGYMTLDIQIPDPEIAPAPSSAGVGGSRTALPMEPLPAITA